MRFKMNVNGFDRRRVPERPVMQTVKDPLEDAINVKTRELKLGMSALGRRLEAGDESELLY